MTQSDPKQKDDPTWWEQHVTRPLRRSFGTAPLDEPSKTADALPADDRASKGTQPLAPDPVPEASVVDEPQPMTETDLDETRPLNHSHVPEPLDLEGTRPLDPALLPQLEVAPVLLATPTSGQAAIMAAALRDIGRTRSVNQDSIYSFISTIPREETDMLLGLFVVADGMGGHAAGEVASRIAITTVARHMLAELLLPAIEEQFGTSLQEVVTEAVQAANRAIWDYANAQGLDMGTTCTAALILGRTIYVGHVGDSRAYVLEDGVLHQLTTDHSAVGRLIQIGALTPEDSREHPLRSQLYRTIGQMPEVQVDFVQQPIGAATHLMLCSDGLWGMVEDPDLARAIVTTQWPQDACAALIQLANEAGGEDNISAVVVRL